MNYPVFSDTKCSDTFIKEYSDGSRSDCVYCEACGRTVCADPNSGSYGLGEYDDLRNKAQGDPKGYVFLGNNINSISYGTLNGHQTVFDCPCNYARFCEDGMTSQPSESPPIQKPGPP